MALRLILAATAASAAPFASWESHGELMDEEALKQPATSQELIDAVGSSKATWVAGENLRFAGATLGEAKILMGTLQDVSNLTRPGLMCKVSSSKTVRKRIGSTGWHGNIS